MNSLFVAHLQDDIAMQHLKMLKDMNYSTRVLKGRQKPPANGIVLFTPKKIDVRLSKRVLRASAHDLLEDAPEWIGDCPFLVAINPNQQNRQDKNRFQALQELAENYQTWVPLSNILPWGDFPTGGEGLKKAEQWLVRINRLIEAGRLKTDPVQVLQARGWRSLIGWGDRASNILKQAHKINIVLCPNYNQPHTGISLHVLNSKTDKLVQELIIATFALLGASSPKKRIMIEITTPSKGYKDFLSIWAGIHPDVRSRPDAAEQLELSFNLFKTVIAEPFKKTLPDNVIVETIPLETVLASYINQAEQVFNKDLEQKMQVFAKKMIREVKGYAQLNYSEVVERIQGDWIAYFATALALSENTVLFDPEVHLGHWEMLWEICTDLRRGVPVPLFAPPYIQPLAY